MNPIAKNPSIAGTGLALAKNIRAGEATIRAAANGWIITRFSYEYVYRTWNEAIEKLAEIFAIDPSMPA